jgi:peptide/nickel transport system substrate-binding protein
MERNVSVIRRLIVGMVCVIAPTVAIGCGGSDAGSSEGSRPVSIRMTEDPADLDPHLTASSVGIRFAYYVYDTIVGRGENGDIVPQLASEWDVTPKSVTFTIRDDVTCSDGSKMTPSVIKANLDRLKDPKVEAPYTEDFFGTLDYKVAADDAAGTVKIDLPKPYSPMLERLTQPGMVCQAGLDNPKLLQSKSIGSGPFVLKEKVADDHYTLAARKGYEWGADGASTAVEGFPSEVTLRIVPNETTAVNQLESGELDIVPVDGPERERLDQQSGLSSQSGSSDVTLLHFNEAEGRATADPAVRKALTQALDRAAMTQAGYGEFASEASSYVAPSGTCFSEAPGDAIPAFDAEAAKQVLSKVAPSLKLYAIDVKGGEYASEAWDEAGAKTDINIGDESGPGLDIVFSGGDWDATLLHWRTMTDVNVIQSYLSGPPPPDGANVGSIDNPTFVEQANKAKRVLGDESCAASDAAQAALFERSDLIPISYTTTQVFSPDDVEFALRGGSTAISPTSLRTTD